MEHTLDNPSHERDSARDAGSNTETLGVTVAVEPHFEPAHSAPHEDRYVFTYRVRIENTSDRPLTLMSRRWTIIDADGQRHGVQGEGVVGQQPRLEPGQHFEYSSWCPLQTPWGTMEGTYLMHDDDGAPVEVAIGRFLLVPVDQAAPEAVAPRI